MPINTIASIIKFVDNIARKSIMFVNYKVSQYLKIGTNRISVWLGNGWYIQIDHLDFELESEYGEIAINWHRTENAIEAEIKIPPETTAHVDLNGRCFDLKCGTYKEVI